ncbi:MAG: aromatic ring-hydroxylating dioxygenase subunit alpha [Pseudomonadota bacterium]
MTSPAAAGLTPGSRFYQALGDTCEGFERAHTLPGACFHHPQILGLERTALFELAWHPVARVEDLAAPGRFRRVELLGQPLLLTRASDGRLHAHYNVCLHRGSRLVDAPEGELEQIRCPYHAWCYSLDGELTHVPRQAEVPLRRLAPVGVTEWQGYVLVNLDADAPALQTQWQDLPDLSAYALPSLRLAHREVYEVRANWKLLCENYSECYHCPGSHPQLARISDYVGGGDKTAPGATHFGASFNGGPMALRDSVGTMSMTGRARLPRIASVPPSDQHLVHYYVIYPNLLLSLHPDYVLLHVLTPTAPDRTRVSCDWLVLPEALRDREAIEDAVQFWDLTNRQDWQLCERNQDGVRARGYAPGPYHASEECVHAFDAWYAGWLRTALAGAAGER